MAGGAAHVETPCFEVECLLAALESGFGATLTLAELSAPRLERRLRPVFTRFYRRLVDLETEALFAEGLTWDG